MIQCLQAREFWFSTSTESTPFIFLNCKKISRKNGIPRHIFSRFVSQNYKSQSSQPALTSFNIILFFCASYDGLVTSIPKRPRKTILCRLRQLLVSKWKILSILIMILGYKNDSVYDTLNPICIFVRISQHSWSSAKTPARTNLPTWKENFDLLDFACVSIASSI